jgi:hypothetical protein
MKALKFALATCLALGLIAVGVLWWDLKRDHAENEADAAVAASVPSDTPDSQGAWKAPPMSTPVFSSKMQTRRADFRPAQPVIDDGKPLPSSPYATPAWNERVPSHATRIDKGLYVTPLK